MQKDNTKGSLASNYGPMTRLQLVWQLMTSIIANENFAQLEAQSLLLVEQKWSRKNSRVTNDIHR